MRLQTASLGSKLFGASSRGNLCARMSSSMVRSTFLLEKSGHTTQEREVNALSIEHKNSVLASLFAKRITSRGMYACIHFPWSNSSNMLAAHMHVTLCQPHVIQYVRACAAYFAPACREPELIDDRRCEVHTRTRCALFVRPEHPESAVVGWRNECHDHHDRKNHANRVCNAYDYSSG